jgi:hypothetical protein
MADQFSPKDGGKVPRSDAEKWMKKYDEERHDKAKDTRSIFFGKEFLHEVLKTPDAAGISFFFAKKYSEYAKKDVLSLVLVPTKADGTLLWPSSTEGKDASTQSAYDEGKYCPPYCT